MTLTELPEDVVKIELDLSRPRSEDVPIPPIQVDKDLLIQVVRVKVQTLIRNAKLREQGQEQEPGKKHDPHCTAERLERLLPVIEQKWLQDLMNGDEPRYGFDEVVKIFQGIVHSDSDIGKASRQQKP
ncbi:TetR family transcriptional regulator [Phytophthora palmivora]|uniref:TetR family transcriptional regulator n=1 Tax=Phytophthora palmivora TaxID=4796 RepID=A0A2P4YIL8_9STRA|nr:TetR family transcriptional regulator [Phytophthora palmivora]